MIFKAISIGFFWRKPAFLLYAVAAVCGIGSSAVLPQVTQCMYTCNQCTVYTHILVRSNMYQDRFIQRRVCTSVHMQCIYTIKLQGIGDALQDGIICMKVTPNF